MSGLLAAAIDRHVNYAACRLAAATGVYCSSRLAAAINKPVGAAAGLLAAAIDGHVGAAPGRLAITIDGSVNAYAGQLTATIDWSVDAAINWHVDMWEWPAGCHHQQACHAVCGCFCLQLA